MDEYIPSDTEVVIAKNRLAREGAELVEIDIPSPATDTSTEQHNTESEPPSKKGKLGSWLRATKQQTTSLDKTPEAIIEDELQRYLKSPKPDPESKPLEWWKLHAPTFPILARLAKKYLCICVSSSASRGFLVFLAICDLIFEKGPFPAKL